MRFILVLLMGGLLLGTTCTLVNVQFDVEQVEVTTNN